MESIKNLKKICVLVGIVFLCAGCLPKKEVEEPVVEKNYSSEKPVQNIVKKEEVKFDLYSGSSYDLPLFSIMEISKLPNIVKNAVDSVLEKSQGFYFLKIEDEKVFIILQNSVDTEDLYQRNTIYFAEIDMEGNVTYYTAGYTESQNNFDETEIRKDDLWIFDETVEPKRPTKHIVYNEKGKVKFSEYWNYDEKEPIKYQMKNSSKKIISVLKESQDNDLNLRKEHIFYDNDGNIIISLSINYDGANISRFTYHNLQSQKDSVSVFSEYENGFKIKEQVYNQNYELIKTLTSEYDAENRKNIKAYDIEGNLVKEIAS